MGSSYRRTAYDLLQVSMRQYPIPHIIVDSYTFSSLLALYNHYKAREGDHAQWDEQTLAAVERTRATVMERCRELLSDPVTSLESISPFFLHCIYTAAILGQSEPQSAIATRDVLVKALRRLERRWQAAGEPTTP